jgi:hypothetical protein
MVTELSGERAILCQEKRAARSCTQLAGLCGLARAARLDRAALVSKVDRLDARAEVP